MRTLAVHPLWIIVEDDDGSVLAVEDTSDLEDASDNSDLHGPFDSVESAKVWIAHELAEVEGMRNPPRLQ